MFKWYEVVDVYGNKFQVNILSLTCYNKLSERDVAYYESTYRDDVKGDIYEMVFGGRPILVDEAEKDKILDKILINEYECTNMLIRTNHDYSERIQELESQIALLVNEKVDLLKVLEKYIYKEGE